MAELRESFPTLEIVGTEAGAALGSRVEGDASAAIKGSIGFSFKDSSGNVVLPQLDSSGKLPVTSESSGNGLYARGTNAGSTSVVTVASLTLVASKRYENLRALVSCFRDSTFQVIFSDNAVETILADIRVGPGHLTQNIDLGELEFLAGATGAQLLLIKGKNENAQSTMTATVSCKQLV